MWSCTCHMHSNQSLPCSQICFHLLSTCHFPPVLYHLGYSDKLDKRDRLIGCSKLGQSGDLLGPCACVGNVYEDSLNVAFCHQRQHQYYPTFNWYGWGEGLIEIWLINPENRDDELNLSTWKSISITVKCKSILTKRCHCKDKYISEVCTKYAISLHDCQSNNLGPMIKKKFP